MYPGRYSWQNQEAIQDKRDKRRRRRGKTVTIQRAEAVARQEEGGQRGRNGDYAKGGSRGYMQKGGGKQQQRGVQERSVGESSRGVQYGVQQKKERVKRRKYEAKEKELIDRIFKTAHRDPEINV